MLFDLFILGSIPFMVFCSLFFIALCFEAHGENLGLSIITIVAFILLMGLCSEIFKWSYAVISANLSLTIAIVVLYFPVGLLWSRQTTKRASSMMRSFSALLLDNAQR